MSNGKPGASRANNAGIARRTKNRNKPSHKHPQGPERTPDDHAARRKQQLKRKKEKKENAFQTSRKFVESRWRVPRAPYERQRVRRSWRYYLDGANFWFILSAFFCSLFSLCLSRSNAEASLKTAAQPPYFSRAGRQFSGQGCREQTGRAGRASFERVQCLSHAPGLWAALAGRPVPRGQGRLAPGLVGFDEAIRERLVQKQGRFALTRTSCGLARQEAGRGCQGRRPRACRDN
jgi:hypothetical protein